MDNDDQRDSQEEAYWSAFCPACGESPCIGEVCREETAHTMSCETQPPHSYKDCPA